MTTKLPLAAIERIMRNAGAEKISSEAVELLRNSTQSLGAELAQDAVAIAKKDGRSQVEPEDIQKAIEAE